MIVLVFLGDEMERVEDVAAIGVGHIKQDLVIVPRDADGKPGKPIEVEPARWDRLVINRKD